MISFTYDLVQSTEFEIDREYVGRIVGSQGAGVNKLRDQLGVKVDVSDNVEDKEKETGKKKKALVHSRSTIKVCLSTQCPTSLPNDFSDHRKEGKRRGG